MTARQAMAYKILNRKLEIQQHEPNKNQGAELKC
jgi:hypothetical protein